VLGTNLDGVHHVVSEFVPGMVERRDGRVVAVSACLGRMSGPGTDGGLAAYRSARPRSNAYTKNLAAELGRGRRGVLVDATCPAHCRTDMGGQLAPRTAAQGAATAVWLAARTPGEGVETGVLWEDRAVVPGEVRCVVTASIRSSSRWCGRIDVGCDPSGADREGCARWTGGRR